jgi:AraC family transcriptional regulator
MTQDPTHATPAATACATDGWIIEETRFAPSQQTEVHHHDGATLSIIFSGGYVERFGGRDLTGDACTAVFKPPQFAHQNEMSTLGLHALYVELGSALMERCCPELALPSGPVALRGPRIAATVARMRREMPHRDDSGELCLQHHLLEILADAARQVVRMGDSPRQPWLARVRARLHEELANAPTIASLALDAGVHPVHLAQAFRRRYGCTIGEYLRECRVARAATALRGRQPIGSIAHDSGFADHSHLTRVFRRMVGCTPAEYRRLVS